MTLYHHKASTILPPTESDEQHCRQHQCSNNNRRGFVKCAAGLGLSFMTNPARSCYASEDAIAVDVMTTPTGSAVTSTATTPHTIQSPTITVPLTFTGQELLVSYQVGGSTFRAVLDTGSPFLMIPGSCGRNTVAKSGCYLGQGKPVPGLGNTIEIFDGFEGEVEWRQAPFAFVDAVTAPLEPGAVGPDLVFDKFRRRDVETSTGSDGEDGEPEHLVIFGVASESIMAGPGGVFFGMIRDTDARIRPSFLSQSNVRSFQVDLKSRPRTLTMSSTPLVPSPLMQNMENLYCIPLTNLLRKRYGDPVGHYTIRAKSIEVNGYSLAVDDASGRSRPILVIVDTGVTGMVISRDLFNQQYDHARKRKDRSLFGTVSLVFETTAMNARDTPPSSHVVLSAVKPLATPFDPDQTWKKFMQRNANNGLPPPHLVVLGLAFLEDRRIGIDIDEETLWVE